MFILPLLITTALIHIFYCYHLLLYKNFIAFIIMLFNLSQSYIDFSIWTSVNFIDNFLIIFFLVRLWSILPRPSIFHCLMSHLISQSLYFILVLLIILCINKYLIWCIFNLIDCSGVTFPYYGSPRIMLPICLDQECVSCCLQNRTPSTWWSFLIITSDLTWTKTIVALLKSLILFISLLCRCYYQYHQMFSLLCKILLSYQQQKRLFNHFILLLL